MMNTNLNLFIPNGFELIRIVNEKGYPFTWLNVYFRYRGKVYVAGYKDARANLHDFEDTDTAISVYNERDDKWHHFITKAYISSVGETKYDGKSVNDSTLIDYFNACFRAVRELNSTEPLA